MSVIESMPGFSPQPLENATRLLKSAEAGSPEGPRTAGFRPGLTSHGCPRVVMPAQFAHQMLKMGRQGFGVEALL
jgi:hypothetical protein